MVKRYVCAVVATCAFACAAAGTEERQASDPPKFRSMSRGEIRSVMLKLADGVVALDKATRRPSPEISRDDVVAQLRMMQEQAALLGPMQRSNHPLLDRNLPAFRGELEAARLYAEATPPSYYLAGAVVGACAYCHGTR